MDYPQHIDDVIDQLEKLVDDGRNIDLNSLVKGLDQAMDNTKIIKWLERETSITRTMFNKAMAQQAAEEAKLVAFNQKYNTDKIEIPKTVREYVIDVCKIRNAYMRLDGLMIQDNKVTFPDGTQADPEDPAIDEESRRALRRMNQNSPATYKLARELQLDNDDLKLGYTSMMIPVAVDEWSDNKVSERRAEFFQMIAYKEIKNKVERAKREDMWSTMIDAYFRNTRQDKEVIKAVIKKFMHQVKGKGSGLIIRNHLVPVITGSLQGAGKSSFVRDMMSPMVDAMREIELTTLTDGKTVDIYESPVLFFDEMAGADKACINAIKTKITATTTSVRIMKTNSAPSIFQKATFIGTSNSSLGNIIYDPTGVRRFYEIEMDYKADIEAVQNIDWLMLWQSVDEYGEDPVTNVISMIQEQQEENRTKTPLECWLTDEHSDAYTTFTKTSVLYERFFQYCDEYFASSSKPSLKKFSTTLKEYIDRQHNKSWEYKSYGGSYQYRKAIISGEHPVTDGKKAVIDIQSALKKKKA